MKQFLRILIDNLSMENRDNILKKEETHIKNNLIISNHSIVKNAIHFNRVVIEHPAKIIKYIEEYDEGLVGNANIIHTPNHLKAEERKGFIKKYKYRNILF